MIKITALVHKYALTSGVSLIAKICMMISSIGVLFILNKAMSKEFFGLFMIAFTLCLLLSSITARFFQSLILYHVSRDETSNGLLRFGLVAGFLTTCVLFVAIYKGADSIAQIANKPMLASFLQGFSFLIPCHALNMIATSFYRASHKVKTMLVYQEIIPSILKLVLCGIVFFIAPSPHSFALAIMASYIIPFCMLFLQSLEVIQNAPRKHLGLWDYKYASFVVVNYIFNKSSRNFIIIFIGFVGSSYLVADVTIGLRLSQILLMPKLILAQMHIPRIGQNLAQNNIQDMMTEFNMLRTISTAITLVMCAGLIMFAPFILKLFGDYQSVYPLILLLSIASIIRSGFGDIGGLVSMAGYADSALLVNIVNFIILAGTFTIAADHLSVTITGMTLVTIAFINMAGFACILKARMNLWVLNLRAVMTMVFPIATLIYILAT